MIRTQPVELSKRQLRIIARYLHEGRKEMEMRMEESRYEQGAQDRNKQLQELNQLHSVIEQEIYEK